MIFFKIRNNLLLNLGVYEIKTMYLRKADKSRYKIHMQYNCVQLNTNIGSVLVQENGVQSLVESY